MLGHPGVANPIGSGYPLGLDVANRKPPIVSRRIGRLPVFYKFRPLSSLDPLSPPRWFRPSHLRRKGASAISPDTHSSFFCAMPTLFHMGDFRRPRTRQRSVVVSAAVSPIPPKATGVSAISPVGPFLFRHPQLIP